ncbi:MAG: DNA polymerase I [Eubacteriales bacterium]|nr:DNA polymerase I [Eubacteriales bacterium]
MAEKLVLIDGNSILNRAFYGLQGRQLLQTGDGLFTNAVYGFINILNMHMEEEKPQYVCAAFDMKAPTFRHMEYDQYKANRKGMPDELAVQLPVVKDVLDTMGIKRMEIEGFEADDIIGSMTSCAEKLGMEVVIITGDRDSLQLAGNNTKIKLTVTKAGKPVVKEYDEAIFAEEYGITPHQFIDVKGLMGDSSDNIPGVKGIGEVTAFKLIREYGSIEILYESLDKVESQSVRKKLEDGRESAFLSKKLAEIDRNMSSVCRIEDTKIQPINKSALLKLFKRLEFNSFIARFGLEEEENKDYEKCEVKYVNDLSGLKSVREAIISDGKFALFPFYRDDASGKVKLAGIGLCGHDKKTVYIDLNGKINEESFLQLFADVLSGSKIKKLGHDMKPFIVHMKNLGCEIDGLEYDTMIAAYLVNPSRQKYDISTLSKDFLDRNIEPPENFMAKGKNYISEKHFIDKHKLASVAGTCAQTVMELQDVLDNKLAENQQRKLLYEIELPLVQVLADMEYWGFKINRKVMSEFSVELDSRIKSLTDVICFMAGEEFNINSTKQLGHILFEKLNLPVIKKTKTGYSTDADVLQRLAGKHEIIDSILEYRQLVKLKSTYVDGLMSVVDPETGKVHSSFNQTIVVTGRISSTEPNLQNIPIKLELGRKIRKLFIPASDEFILVDADYSQIELRVLAHISGDENMISAFKKEEDIHRATAAKIFDVSSDQVTPRMRNSAKAVNFGIVYGIGEYSLSQDLEIPRKEAAKYIKDYLDKYPGVRQYMHDIIETGKKQGYVTTMFGRIRYIPEINDRNFNIRSFGERIALNTPIQGTAADIIKIAMVSVYKKLKQKGMKSRLILQVHDELIVEAHKSETEEIRKIVCECMENAAKLLVPLSVDINSGSNWYDAKQL